MHSTQRLFKISGRVNAGGRVSGAVGAAAKGGVAGDGAKREREALAVASDEYLQLLEDNDAVFIAGPSGRVCTDHVRATELDHSIARTQRRLLRLCEHQELAETCSTGGLGKVGENQEPRND